uniref:Uncharacterized protein n=1 Tax=Ixodes ricinus TaxID=34613 RepID=A0A6B0USC9_IXORI
MLSSRMLSARASLGSNLATWALGSSSRMRSTPSSSAISCSRSTTPLRELTTSASTRPPCALIVDSCTWYGLSPGFMLRLRLQKPLSLHVLKLLLSTSETCPSTTKKTKSLNMVLLQGYAKGAEMRSARRHGIRRS